MTSGSSLITMTSSTKASQTPTSPFGKLPTEIHAMIAGYLTFPNNQSFKLTSRHFYALTRPPTHEELLAAEKQFFPRFFTCKICLRLRPKHKFSDSMITGQRGSMGAKKRFCIDCGINPKRGKAGYPRGTLFTAGGVKWVLCFDCRMVGCPPVCGSDKKRCHMCWGRWYIIERQRQAVEQELEEEKREQREKLMEAKWELRQAKRALEEAKQGLEVGKLKVK